MCPPILSQTDLNLRGSLKYNQKINIFIALKKNKTHSSYSKACLKATLAHHRLQHAQQRRAFHRGQSVAYFIYGRWCVNGYFERSRRFVRVVPKRLY
jgi:hypothetical protein